MCGGHVAVHILAHDDNDAAILVLVLDDLEFAADDIGDAALFGTGMGTLLVWLPLVAPHHLWFNHEIPPLLRVHTLLFPGHFLLGGRRRVYSLCLLLEWGRVCGV